jgi:hypothetical protein
MNNPEIPEGWRWLEIGEPIPPDAMWLDDNKKNVWRQLNPKSLHVGDRYLGKFRPMITNQPAGWRSACGVIDIGTDR